MAAANAWTRPPWYSSSLTEHAHGWLQIPQRRTKFILQLTETCPYLPMSKSARWGDKKYSFVSWSEVLRILSFVSWPPRNVINSKLPSRHETGRDPNLEPLNPDSSTLSQGRGFSVSPEALDPKHPLLNSHNCPRKTGRPCGRGGAQRPARRAPVVGMRLGLCRSCTRRAMNPQRPGRGRTSRSSGPSCCTPRLWELRSLGLRVLGF